MEEQVLSLLKSIPKNHPLSGVVSSVLLPELQSSVEIKISSLTSEFEHFSGIYGRRYRHLTKRKIPTYGILESIPSMAAHAGQKQLVSIHTQNFNVMVWMDPDLKKLIGLVLVAKQPDSQD
jgi:hypothetical protein